jgi:hypothetical protein
MANDDNVRESADEIEVDDDALEMVSGGLKNVVSNTTYSVNQTIYFQSYVTNVDGSV